MRQYTALPWLHQILLNQMMLLYESQFQMTGIPINMTKDFLLNPICMLIIYIYMYFHCTTVFMYHILAVQINTFKSKRNMEFDEI